MDILLATLIFNVLVLIVFLLVDTVKLLLWKEEIIILKEEDTTEYQSPPLQFEEDFDWNF